MVTRRLLASRAAAARFNRNLAAGRNQALRVNRNTGRQRSVDTMFEDYVVPPEVEEHNEEIEALAAEMGVRGARHPGSE